MIIFVSLILAVAILVVVQLLLRTPAEKSAALITGNWPLLMVAIGVLLTLLGRGGIGVPLSLLALSWWQRKRYVGRATGGRGRGQKSKVRTTVLEMELDHDTGAMDGWVLAGMFEGARLSRLDREDLLKLYRENASDGESIALLEAYLDRCFNDWREQAGTREGSGPDDATGSAPMTRDEAYQILGLEPGASEEEIHQAWRRLMKKVHPDSGGSAFLAAKINAARETLLD
ncbi:J domain-containing protein [Desulfofustis limnaeus]|jgi:hypothetical protein|uniref:Molecular chaperone DnaJ n=1 Tax=Desulfofustis limnaeus TaxID=2740163 RepID=A0ABM7W5L8_9BACT|nr:DnaJ domain-containing protein [Desulfofustis limnaeus]MDX9896065.1 DnaJ domain-containing protein [Desulfofustis sp.]BDD86211.1 molecular chaperone DnaJ [Desulfofustis limnaeus]